MTVHTAPLLCDGRRWLADGWILVADGQVTDWGTGAAPPGHPVERHGTLLPGLVDSCARVTGYFNRVITGDALAPHRACLELAAEAGVGMVLDVGGHTEPCAALAELGAGDGPSLLWTGPVLDGPPVATTATRLVLGADAARRAVAGLAADGACGVSTGPSLDARLLGKVVVAAREHGMPVTHRPGRTDAVEAAKAGVRILRDLPRCLLGAPAAGPGGSGGGPSPAALVRAFADPAVRRAAGERLRVLAGHGVTLVPLLHARRRSALLDEAVAEPRLDRLVPLAPFHQYLLDMRGPGLVFGRKYAREHFGFETLKGPARKEFDDGWSFLLEALATAHASGMTLLPGSDALGLSLVPGYGLYDELSWWERAGIPRRAVLTAATGGAVDTLAGRARAASPWATGVLALSGALDTLPALAALPAAARTLARPRFDPQETRP
ncbi:hypothetical protein [Streptomyces sp. ISL-86]|uniref:hypothetical protein n=1 Tax=Streptomyces sp. ISL-86 TaxID=2819187 RepID=UPI001BEBED7B|nr:hypothetical protein [Streptomyces sp. ISL-86]MBT2455553.1 hypothetical protein [Streptomyces sp. ISL-86]